MSQPPKTSTTIYECSRENSQTQYSNSEWVNQFSEGIDLKRGDVIRILGSFVEETNTDQSIVIEQEYKANLEFIPYITALSFGSSDNIEASENGFQSTLGQIAAPALSTDALGTEPPLGVKAPTLSELGLTGVAPAIPGFPAGDPDGTAFPGLPAGPRNIYAVNSREDFGNYMQATSSVGGLFGGMENHYLGMDNLSNMWEGGSGAGGMTFALNVSAYNLTGINVLPAQAGLVQMYGTEPVPLYNSAFGPVSAYQSTWQGKHNSYFGDPSSTRLVGSEWHNCGSGYNILAGDGPSPLEFSPIEPLNQYFSHNWGTSRDVSPFVSLEDEAFVVGSNVLTHGRGRGGEDAPQFCNTNMPGGLPTPWGEMIYDFDYRPYSNPRQVSIVHQNFVSDTGDNVTSSPEPIKGLYRTTDPDLGTGWRGSGAVVAPFRLPKDTDVVSPDEADISMNNFNKLSLENQFYISTMCKLVYLPAISGMSFNPSDLRIPGGDGGGDGREDLFASTFQSDFRNQPNRIKSGNYLTTYLISNKRGFYENGKGHIPLEETGWELGKINWKWGPQAVVGKILAVQKEKSDRFKTSNDKLGNSVQIPMYKCYVTDWMTPSSYKSISPATFMVDCQTIQGVSPGPSRTGLNVRVRADRHGGGDLPNGYNRSALYNKVNGYPLQDTRNPYYHTCHNNLQDQNMNGQPKSSQSSFYKGSPNEQNPDTNKEKGLGIGVDNGVNFLWSGKGNPTNFNLELGSWTMQQPAAPVGPGGYIPSEEFQWAYNDGQRIEQKLMPSKPEFYQNRLRAEMPGEEVYWEMYQWFYDATQAYLDTTTPGVTEAAITGADYASHYDVGAIVCLTETMLENDQTKPVYEGVQEGQIDNFFPTFTQQNAECGYGEGVSPYLTRNFSQMVETEDYEGYEQVKPVQGKGKNEGLMKTTDKRLLILDLPDKVDDETTYKYAKDRQWTKVGVQDGTAPIICSPPMYEWSTRNADIVGVDVVPPQLTGVPKFIINDTPMYRSCEGRASIPNMDVFLNVFPNETPERHGSYSGYFPSHYNQSNCSIYFQNPSHGANIGIREEWGEDPPDYAIGSGLYVEQDQLFECDLLTMAMSVAEITIPVGNYNAASLSEKINEQLHMTNAVRIKKYPNQASNVGITGVKNTPGCRNNIVRGNFVQSYVPDLTYGFTPLTPEMAGDAQLNPGKNVPTTTDVTTLLYSWDDLLPNGENNWNDTAIINGRKVSDTFRGKIYSVPSRTQAELDLPTTQISLIRLKGGALDESSYPSKTNPVTDPMINNYYNSSVAGSGNVTGADPGPCDTIYLQHMGGGEYETDATFNYDLAECRRHGVLEYLSINGGLLPSNHPGGGEYITNQTYPTIFPYYSRTNMNKLSYGGSAKIFVGVNNPTFSFDPVVNKNYFSNLYIPFRPNTSQNPNDKDDTNFGLGDAIPSVIIDANNNGEILGQYGGVYIYGLNADAIKSTEFQYNTMSGMVLNSDTTPEVKAQGEALWALLGFTQAQIDTFKTNTPIGDVKPYIHISEDNTFGTSPVRNSPIVDIAVNASNPFRGNLTLVAGLPQTLVQADSDRELASSEGLRYSQPYYFIGTDLPIESVHGQMTGAKLPVAGLCARNFERENFVFDVGASSIDCLIKEDTTITSIRTKIYDATMGVPKSIGGKSSIIYEILRQNVDKNLEGQEAQQAGEMYIQENTPIPVENIDFGENPPRLWRYGMGGLVPPTEINSKLLMAAWLGEPQSDPLILKGDDESDESDYE